MKKAVITGADGFIGGRLLRLLIDSGYFVYCVGLNEDSFSDLNAKDYKFIKATFDIYDRLSDLIHDEDISLFYHFAWNGVFGEAFKDYSKQLDNVKYCAIALEQAIKLGCKKFILASTVNTLETRAYFGMDNIEPRYTNIYATCKLSAEMICKTIAFQRGIEFNCGLIAMVYGEKNNSMMVPNVVIKNLFSNQPSNLVPYDTPYDLIYVGDVAEAFKAIGEKGKNLKTYYVGHKTIQKFGEIFDNIKQVINPMAVLNYGVYPDKTLIDYNLISTNDLFDDTGLCYTTDFKSSVLITAEWIKNRF